MQYHGRVQRYQHTRAHHGIENIQIIAQCGKYQQNQQQQQSPSRTNQCSGHTVERVFAGILYIGLHTDNSRYRRFCRHILSPVSPEIIKNQTDKYGNSSFDNTLSDARKGKNFQLFMRRFQNPPPVLSRKPSYFAVSERISKKTLALRRQRGYNNNGNAKCGRTGDAATSPSPEHECKTLLNGTPGTAVK